MSDEKYFLNLRFVASLPLFAGVCLTFQMENTLYNNYKNERCNYLPIWVKLLTVLALRVCHPFFGIDAVSNGNPICFWYKSNIAWGITTLDLSIFGRCLKPNKDIRLVSTSANTSLGTLDEYVLQQHSSMASSTSHNVLGKFMMAAWNNKKENW